MRIRSATFSPHACCSAPPSRRRARNAPAGAAPAARQRPRPPRLQLPAPGPSERPPTLRRATRPGDRGRTSSYRRWVTATGSGLGTARRERQSGEFLRIHRAPSGSTGHGEPPLAAQAIHSRITVYPPDSSTRAPTDRLPESRSGAMHGRLARRRNRRARSAPSHGGTSPARGGYHTAWPFPLPNRPPAIRRSPSCTTKFAARPAPPMRSFSRTTTSAPKCRTLPISSATHWDFRVRPRARPPGPSCSAASISWRRPPRFSRPQRPCCFPISPPAARWPRRSMRRSCARGRPNIPAPSSCHTSIRQPRSKRKATIAVRRETPSTSSTPSPPTGKFFSCPTCSSARTYGVSRGARTSACGWASATCTPESIREHRPQRSIHPEAEFLVHPECGCATSVVEAVSAGDVDPEKRMHILSTEGMIKRPGDHRTSARVHRGHGDRHPAPAAPRMARQDLLRRERACVVRLHEGDDAPQGARVDSPDAAPDHRAGIGRRPGAPCDRAHGVHRRRRLRGRTPTSPGPRASDPGE